MRYIPDLKETAWVKIVQSTSFPAAATVELTSIPQSFTDLKLTVIGASNATTTRFLEVQVDSDNGASYDATAGNYLSNYIQDGVVSISSVATMGPNVDGHAGISNAADFDFVLFIFDYKTSRPTWMMIGIEADSHPLVIHGAYIGGTPINAIKLLWNNTGNFDAGTYMLEAK